MDSSLGAAYEPEKVFDWVIQVMRQSLPIDAAYLALRVGDVFRIDAFWNYDPAILGNRIPIYSSRELRLVQATLRGMLTRAPFTAFEEVGKLSFQPSSVLTMPICLGQRLIGIMVFASAKSPGLQDEHRERAAYILERLAHAIESAIIFDDISRYLQQSILLSELATAATIKSEPSHIARRLVRRLARTFHTDQVAVLLVSSDGKNLSEFGGNQDTYPLTIPVSESLLGYVVETGLPYRSGKVADAPRFLREERPIQSFLAAPLKYRGRVIGVIGIESLNREAFTVQDEQLLVVIASQLAGILENVRLMQDANRRAKNLGLIHQVLTAVVGMVNIEEIAAEATNLVAEYFGYDLVSILLPDHSGRKLNLVGAGGEQAAKLKDSWQFSIQQGITGRVYRTGLSCYSNDVSDDPDYFFTDTWAASAELAVPLRSGDQILGVIDCQRAGNNVFTDDDILLIEALAGILTSVLANARRYEESQRTITQLDLVRETALEISNLELDMLINRIIQNARLLVNAPGAELGLYEPENGYVKVLASENPWYRLQEGIRPLGMGVTGRIVQTGMPLSVADYNSWDGRMYPEQPHPCTAVAGIPLMIKGDVIGSLIVMDDVPGRVFTEHDIHLLELLAPQVAISIRNARLYRELHERIEAQKQAERQLLQSARMAAVGEMAAGVAHELNNPLTTVTGFVELALEELPPNLPQRDELELVLVEANRARKVVRRLLDFSRQSEHQRLFIDPGVLLHELLPLIQHQAHGIDIQINVDCQEGMSPILIDSDQIKQVLLNLAQNAIQSMPNGGVLWIRTESMNYDGQAGIVFLVRDTGEGISPEHIDRVFEPFFTTRQVGTGTGLGLSVSYGIVTDHNGQIWVESQIGQGSIFRVWLPVQYPAQFESE